MYFGNKYSCSLFCIFLLLQEEEEEAEAEAEEEEGDEGGAGDDDDPICIDWFDAPENGNQLCLLALQIDNTGVSWYL